MLVFKENTHLFLNRQFEQEVDEVGSLRCVVEF